MEKPRDDINALVNRICKDEFGALPAYVSAIESGVVNSVYEIGLDDEKKFVLRISNKTEDTLTPEIWAINSARSAGVPVADILLVGETQTSDSLARFSLQSFITGLPLTEYLESRSRTEETNELIGKSVGRMLNRIHSTYTEGFGYIENEKGTYATKHEWLDRLFAGRDELQGYLGDTLEIDTIFSIIHAGAMQDYGSPRLLHGDYKMDHIFINPETLEISGVIDFEEASSGDPILDLVTWEFHSGDEIKTEYVKNGYEENGIFGEMYHDRYRAMYLYKCLYMLRYYSAHSPNDVKAQSIREKIYFVLAER